MRRERKGQSVLEYILVLVAIIAAIIVFTQPGGVIQNAVGGLGTQASTAINNAAARIK